MTERNPTIKYFAVWHDRFGIWSQNREPGLHVDELKGGDGFTPEEEAEMWADEYRGNIVMAVETDIPWYMVFSSQCADKPLRYAGRLETESVAVSWAEAFPKDFIMYFEYEELPDRDILVVNN